MGGVFQDAASQLAAFGAGSGEGERSFLGCWLFLKELNQCRQSPRRSAGCELWRGRQPFKESFPVVVKGGKGGFRLGKEGCRLTGALERPVKPLVEFLDGGRGLAGRGGRDSF